MRGSGLGLEVYADADYADKANNRRSMSGIAIIMEGTVVSHVSKAQHVVSLSTSKAEYITAGDGVNLCLLVPYCLVLRPRRVGQALRPFRTARRPRR